MLKEFDVPTARRVIGYEESIDAQIAQEQEMLRLRESRPDITDPKVSARARDAWYRMHWRNCQRVRHHKIRNQSEFTKQRGGRTLHMLEFVLKLNTLPRRRFFLNDWSVLGFRGLNIVRGSGRPQYVGAVQNGAMPEWSVIGEDAHGLRRREKKRGWRTVLTILLDQKLITEKEVLQLFGFPAGQSGRVFRMQLWEARNRKLWDGEENSEYFRLKPRAEFDETPEEEGGQ